MVGYTEQESSLIWVLFLKKQIHEFCDFVSFICFVINK